MDTKLLRAVALFCLAGVINPAYADRKDQPISLQKSMFTLESQKQIADQTRQKVNRISTAVKRYYTKNMSKWPSSLADISSVYDGDFNTPAGEVSGSQTGLRYSLMIDLRSTDPKLVTQLSSMAQKNHGSLSGSILTFSIESDQSIAAMESSLSRYIDPSGELNKMYTGINVNSQDINNINSISINDAQIGTVTYSEANISSETVDSKSVSGTNIVSSDSTDNLTVTNNNLSEATVSSLVVTNTNSVTNTATINANSGINVNGVMVVDSAGQLYLDGQDLNARYAGINEKVINSEKLGGLDSSLFVRKDATNYFTAAQNFNGGLIASTIAATSLATNTVSTSNHFKTNTGTVGNIKVGNDWFSNTKNRSHTNETEIRNLENIGSIRKIGTWRYKGEYRVGGGGAKGGAVCLSINSWAHESYQGTVRECWSGSGSDNSSGGCRDKQVTKYRAYQCR
ncbi:conserved exported hypothetical protein [Vibrio chagasii]|nr:conserved exported hypothetical protein [Vibrio chagasii]CAH6960866.1 conserved exported hypothetical protein [Vibrio chagasii]